MTSPYFSISNYDFTSIVTYSGSVSPSGGDLKVDEYNYPWRNYATAVNSGRKLRKYAVEVASLVRSDIETFMNVVNNAQQDDEFCPGDSDRAAYVYMAHAEATKPDLVANPSTGIMCWWYKAKAEITVRGAWLYGPDQGQVLVSNKTIPCSSAFTNNGNIAAGIDYVLASGGYDTDYMKNLGVYSYLTNSNELQGYILLCTKMMRNDRLEFNRWGEVRHQYSTNFPMIYAELQKDLQGSGFMNYGTGGSIGLNALHLGNNGKIIMPFWGPLPISLPPYLEVWVTAITGTPIVQSGNASDLSDLAGWSHTLQLGYNKIYTPLNTGMTDVFFGITTGASDAITISSIKGVVNRYVAPSSMYLPDPGATFTFVVTSFGGGTLLSQLEYNYRDLFYF